MPERFPCPGCQADMEFDPKSGAMKCPYCGRVEAVPAASAVRPVTENDLEAFLTPDAARLARLAENAVQVTCSGCGATTEFTPPEVAGLCPFCGAKIVAQPVAADPLIAPEAVLPFAVPKKEAVAAIKRWLATRWFAPNALKKMAQQDGITGVYLPFWTYDAQTWTRYTGERGEHYYITETYTERDANGDIVTRERQVQKTRWYPASGKVERFFDDVLIPATRSVPSNRLNQLEPWDLEAVVSYTPAYLSGFKAQRYQVDLGEGYGQAKDIMAGVIHGDVRRAIGGDEQRVHRIDTQYTEQTFKHLLLPVWIAAYRFDNKIYQVLVNARTGEVQGERPYSVGKIVLLVLVVLAAIALFLYLRQGQAPPPEGFR